LNGCFYEDDDEDNLCSYDGFVNSDSHYGVEYRTRSKDWNGSGCQHRATEDRLRHKTAPV